MFLLKFFFFKEGRGPSLCSWDKARYFYRGYYFLFMYFLYISKKSKKIFKNKESMKIFNIIPITGVFWFRHWQIVLGIKIQIGLIGELWPSWLSRTQIWPSVQKFPHQTWNRWVWFRYQGMGRDLILFYLLSDESLALNPRHHIVPPWRWVRARP